MYGYATFDAFRPITSQGTEKRIEDLRIFAGIRKAYDHTFKSISDVECRAVFERLAPEYTVVMNETLHVRVDEKKTLVTEKDLLITGQEQEFKTFFLDEYQVGIVNDMGKGHRVILANPGAGKSVLLLSKAFKYASLYKESNVLLTCYNNNLADSYNFKRNCANFGENKNLFIMTFHKLVKKIYEECLHSHCASNIATEEEIQKCIDLVKQGKINLRFKAIFIDEVQIFDPLYLELCYRLLEDDDDRVFLMAGDLNQAVRAMSRKGDAPWKRMNGIQLDFKGRVRYIEKNYRNSKDIGEYIASMLQHMNNRLTMLDLINSLEYEYNSFKVGSNLTIALNVQTGVNRMEIKARTIAAVKEIAQKYRISYSEIAVLFPFRQVPYHNYRFLYWLKQGFDDEGNVSLLPYRMYRAVLAHRTPEKSLPETIAGKSRDELALPLPEPGGSSIREFFLDRLGISEVTREEEVQTANSRTDREQTITLETLVWESGDRAGKISEYLHHYEAAGQMQEPEVVDQEQGVYFLKEVAKLLYYARLARISNSGETSITPQALAGKLRKIWPDTRERLAYLCQYQEKLYDELRSENRTILNDQLFLDLVGEDVSEVLHAWKGGRTACKLKLEQCKEADEAIRDYAVGKLRRANHTETSIRMEERYRCCMRNLQRRCTLAHSLRTMAGYTVEYQQTPLGKMGVAQEKLRRVFGDMEEMK